MTQPTPTVPPQRKFTITTPGKAEVPSHFCLLVVGDAKSGKSHFGCTAPDPLFMQFDPNTAAVEKFAHPRIDDLNSLSPKQAYQLWDRDILPAIYNRELDCETIVVDTYTFLARAAQDHIGILKDKGGNDDTWAHYRKLYDLLKADTMKLRSVTRPFPRDPDRRRYNVVVLVHAAPQYKRLDAQNQVLDKYTPQIDGKFAREFGSFFGSVFWSESYEHVAKTTPPSPPETRFRMWTKPPDKFRNCLDSYGGPPGPLATLPRTIENTWSALMNGWGLPLKENT